MPKAPHDSTLYALGRGIVSIAEYAGEVCGEYADVGNCSSFEAEVTEETLPHWNYRSQSKVKDKTVTIETGYGIEFILDEISVGNLAKFLRGSINSRHIIYAAQELEKEYRVKFISDNQVGPNETWEFWKCKLTPSSAINLISDVWKTLEFAGEGLADTVNHATSPYFTVTCVTTTSSTSTTTTTS